MKELIKETVQFLKSNAIETPELGIVLGTGLGKLANEVVIDTKIKYEDIPNFPVSTVESHSGELIYGTLCGKKVIMMKGRFHYYEGYSMQEITFPIKVMKLMGIKRLILSNAAGAINLKYKKGDLMLLNDHINMQFENPLIGKNEDDLGDRFPDMSEPYDKSFNTIFTEEAKKIGIRVHKGTYVSVQGPNLETKAEYRFLSVLGADAVGMSTVPEVIVANHMGIPCNAISVLTDECDPDNLKPVNISEIIEVAGRAEVGLVKLITSVISRFN